MVSIGTQKKKLLTHLNVKITKKTGDERLSIPPIIFIHGFPLSSEMWKPTIDMVSHLTDCISYDLAGFGRSARLPFLPLLEARTNALLTIIQELRFPHVILCGHDIGGYIALRAIERIASKPNCIAAAILCNVLPYAPTPSEIVSAASHIETIHQKGATQFVNTYLRTYCDKSSFEDPESVLHTYVDYPYDSNNLTDGFASILTRTSTLRTLQSFPNPTLLISGLSDPLIPDREILRLAVTIDAVSIVRMPECGHFSPVEDHHFFAHTLTNFLTQLARPSR